MPLELTSTVGRGRDRTRIPRRGFPLPSPVRIHNKHEHIHYKNLRLSSDYLVVGERTSQETGPRNQPTGVWVAGVCVSRVCGPVV